jgi:predicted dehydrogenase
VSLSGETRSTRESEGLPINMAQYGVGHGHAAGKMRAMRANHDVDVAGMFEPDQDLRAQAEQQRGYEGVRWYHSGEEMLADTAIAAVAVEGRNADSLAMAVEVARAGKHLWYDKPAGDDWDLYQELIAIVRRRGLVLQMGYMFRYQDAFQRLAEWTRGGLLGEVFSIRGHMSTWIPVQGGAFTRATIGRHHAGGILYDLSGHMLDQVLWLLGDERPARVASFLRNDATSEVPQFQDNTLGVYEFSKAMAIIDIASMEVEPKQRRFEVYGSQGSAILDPMEPCPSVKLILDDARGGFQKGLQEIPTKGTNRQQSYELELQGFLRAVRGERPPDRPLEHEILVQETLLRATGRIS